MSHHKNANSIETLLSQVSRLAGWYRNAVSIEEKNDAVKKYDDTIHRLYELGWDDVLDVDDELPDRFLPQIYLDKAPTAYMRQPNSES